jgi:hypothetical protein
VKVKEKYLIENRKEKQSRERKKEKYMEIIFPFKNFPC